MKFKLFQFLFILAIFAAYGIDAKRFSSGSSRSSSSSRSHSYSSRTSSGSRWGSSHSSGSHTSGSHTSGSHSTSGSHTSGSHSTGGSHSSSGSHTSGSHTSGSYSPGNHASTAHTSSSVNTNFLQAEGGGAARPTQTKPSYAPSAPPASFDSHPTIGGSYGTHSAGHPPSPGLMTESKQKNPSPFAASAPPADSISKQNTNPLQNQVPGSFGYPNAPTSFGQPNTRPTWSNPHFGTNTPNSQPSHIGFNGNTHPTSNNSPYPTSHGNPPYPTSHGNPPYPTSHGNPPYPTSHGNPPYPTSQGNPPHIGFKENVYPTSHGAPPYPVPNGHPSYPPFHGSGNSPFPSNNPTSFHPAQASSFSNSFSHPNQVPLGNPYTTQPVGSAYAPGQTYYPQQGHMLGQSVAQPYTPGQTVIMVPGQQDSGRGLGQMFKEALVFSTVNAGVNRLINPYPHYHPSESASSGAAGSTTTHITYNNHYFNTVPGINGTVDTTNVSPGSGPDPAPASPSPGSYNPFSPAGMTGSIPASPGNTNAGSIGTNTMSGTSSVGGGVPIPATGANTATGANAASTNTSNQSNINNSTPVPTLQYRISDEELYRISEKLFKMSSISISDKIKLNLQNRTVSTNGTLNITDIAKDPLFYVEPELLDYPSIYIIRSLYDNYEQNASKKENRTLEKRMEENLLIDTFLNTNTMSTAMQWLSDNSFIDPDDFERKDTLRHIWFTQFDGTTSGFERIFVSEIYGGTDILGVQDWIYFEYLENLQRINYMGYVDKLELGDGASLLKFNFEMNGIIRPNATMFVGTLPELEMSLYTICFYARPNNLCPISLGGTKFNIFTHSFRYFGMDLIDLALPIF